MVDTKEVCDAVRNGSKRIAATGMLRQMTLTSKLKWERLTM